MGTRTGPGGRDPGRSAARRPRPQPRLGGFGRAAASLLGRLGLAARGWTWQWLDLADHPDLAAKTGPDEELLGLCDHDAHVLYFARQHVLADPWEEVRDTLRHEAAHALAGFHAGHGRRWRAAAIRLGARPEAGPRRAHAPPQPIAKIKDRSRAGAGLLGGDR